MAKLPPIPTIADAERTPLVEALLGVITALLGVITALQEENHRLREQVDLLKAEVARLKGHKGKPKIRPSSLEKKNPKRKKRGKKNRDRSNRLEIEAKPVIVQAPDVPEGSRFKGYSDFMVQELVIEARATCYRLEKWQTPDGQVITAPLPHDAHGHFGPTLMSFVLYQYYHAQVTEPLIAEQLREWGVEIGTGQVHRILVEGKDKFHDEKDAILEIGLRVSRYIHVDDTGARHQGQNGVCTHIGNDAFAWFASTESKSRINFLSLLRAGHTDYVLSGEALEYMAAQNMPKSVLKSLAPAQGGCFADDKAWQDALRKWGIRKALHVRIATEGALLGSVLHHGIHPDLAIVSDDAGQFNVLLHALCWIHAERNLAKLLGFNDQQRKALDDVRSKLWRLYRDLKAFKRRPREELKSVLSRRFDALCDTKTCFVTLNNALKRMKKNKPELLLVLERPDLPLHNNLSEGDIREYVKKRKISGPTRSHAGRRCRDTFASLKKTCRKNAISFWNFLLDRIRGDNQIPPLPAIIEARAQPP